MFDDFCWVLIFMGASKSKSKSINIYIYICIYKYIYLIMYIYICPRWYKMHNFPWISVMNSMKDIQIRCNLGDGPPQWQIGQVHFESLACTLPETTIFAPENGWLEDYFPIGGPGLSVHWIVALLGPNFRVPSHLLSPKFVSCPDMQGQLFGALLYRICDESPFWGCWDICIYTYIYMYV